LYLTLAISGFAIPFLVKLQIQQQRLRGLQKIVKSQFPQEIVLPLLLLVGIKTLDTLRATSLNSLSVIAIHTLAIIFSYILINKWLVNSIPTVSLKQPWPKEIKKKWLEVAYKMMFISGFNLILAQTDILMLGFFHGTAEAGFYAIGVKLTAMLVFVLVAFNSIMAPMMTNLYHQGAINELQRIVRLGANGAFWGSMVVAAMLFFFRTQILNIFGEDFVAGSQVTVMILTVGQLINAFAGPVAMLLNMTGQQNAVAKILGISAVANITLNFILIPQYGSLGAAIATLVTIGFWNIAMLVVAKRRIGIITLALPLTLSNRL
jgi:O-antigen/teichoic acid export membrane protein